MCQRALSISSIGLKSEVVRGWCLGLDQRAVRTEVLLAQPVTAFGLHKHLAEEPWISAGGSC